MVIDYCRFIEWMGCCCSGGYRFVANVKEERGVEHHLSPLCKDGHFQHPISTKACEALAQLPSSMPLYSGYNFLSLSLKILTFHSVNTR